MGTYSWAETLDKAAEAFGKYPGAEIEQELLEVFRERPAFVVGVIQDVMRGYQAGRIHSPWMLVRKQAAAVPTELVVTDHAERDRAVARARQWMRAAGFHFDRWSEVDQFLFAPVELTAPLEQLEELERTTRDKPGRFMYEGLLKAAIERTRREGRQEVPESVGMLVRWSTPELREEFRGLWAEVKAEHDPGSAEIPF